MNPAPSRSSSDDRCPGALRLHAADDGHVARIRVPGGRLDPARLVALADLAEALGDGELYLTSRGNVQVRGLAGDSGQAVADRLYASGLLPSVTHDRVRNLVASPLSGIDGVTDVEVILAELDEAILDDDRLVALSGRFLFGIDAGPGDVLALRPDVAVVPCTTSSGVAAPAAGSDDAPAWRLVVAGRETAVTAPLDLAADLLVGAAHRFLALRADHAPHAWRATELPGAALAELAPGRPGPQLADPVTRCSQHFPPAAARGKSGEHGVTAGVGLGRHGVAVVAGVRLGSAPADTWRAVATLATDIRLTPWRSVVLANPADAGAATAALEDLGFLLDDADPLAPVTACIGRPGCAKALADVRADAPTLAADHPGRRLHVAGCDRRCGRPAGPHLSAVASPDGYQTQEH